MKPELQYASADADTVQVRWSTALDDSAPPPASAFDVRVDGVAVPVTAVEFVFNAGTLSIDTVKLTLATPVIDGQIVSFRYTDPSAGDDAAEIQDLHGDDAASVFFSWIPNVTDKISPSVAVTVDDHLLTVGETAQVTLTFSERPSNFDPASVIVTNGVLTGLAPTADRNVFIGTFTPSGDGPCSVEVAAGSYMDATQSPGARGRVDFAADVTPPTVVASTNDQLLSVGEDAVVTFTFSERPVGFDASDVAVLNGVLLRLEATADPRVYTALARPSAEGTMLVGVVDGGVFSDAAGNPGNSDLVRLTVDFKAPKSLVYIAYDGVLVAGQTIPVQFGFNEDPGASFTLADIVVENGVLTDFTDNRPFGGFSAQLRALADGPVRVAIPDGSFRDPAGNPGQGSSATLMADATLPTVAVTVDDAMLAAGQAAHVTFSFSEAPIGFAAADVGVTNGAISGFAATADPKVYTAVFTPGAEGAAGVAVASGSFTDSVGNAGVGASISLSADFTAPTVTVAISPAEVDRFHSATVTFAFSEAPSGFAAADVTTAGGQIAGFTGTSDPKIYTAIFTPARAGAASVGVTAGTYTDSHGNPGGSGAVAFTVNPGAPPPPPPPPTPPDTPTDGPDVIRLPSAGGTVSAGTGDDWVSGAGSSDWIHGNAGQDTLMGGGGADTMMGGRDNDWLQGEPGDDMVFGDLGDDIADGGEGDDLVQGNAGNDTLSGGAGDDRVYGGKGDDRLIGGDGADWLFGDLGSDTIVGGAGADRFCFPDGAAGQDVIGDFSRTEGDVIWISPALSANFEALLTHVTAAANGDALITLGLQTITLAGVAPGSLMASDFLFG